MRRRSHRKHAWSGRKHAAACIYGDNVSARAGHRLVRVTCFVTSATQNPGKPSTRTRASTRTSGATERARQIDAETHRANTHAHTMRCSERDTLRNTKRAEQLCAQYVFRGGILLSQRKQHQSFLGVSEQTCTVANICLRVAIHPRSERVCTLFACALRTEVDISEGHGAAKKKDRGTSFGRRQTGSLNWLSKHQPRQNEVQTVGPLSGPTPRGKRRGTDSRFHAAAPPKWVPFLAPEVGPQSGITCTTVGQTEEPKWNAWGRP